MGKMTPEYRAWQAIKVRCYNENCWNYKRYGGRGIKMCDEWLHDSRAFRKHIGPRPTPEHSLDRIDNNKGYEPGNVRWATKREQSVNCRVRSDNTSGTCGVFYAPDRAKWRVVMYIYGKCKYIGSFFDKDEAILARKQAEKIYYKTGETVV